MVKLLLFEDQFRAILKWHGIWSVLLFICSKYLSEEVEKITNRWQGWHHLRFTDVRWEQRFSFQVQANRNAPVDQIADIINQGEGKNALQHINLYVWGSIAMSTTKTFSRYSCVETRPCVNGRRLLCLISLSFSWIRWMLGACIISFWVNNDIRIYCG